jgi:GTPase SAR1 family protein
MKTLVVWGLGGAGKTQLVLDYVRQYHTDYKMTFSIEAGRKELLERDIVNLY